MTAVSPKFCFDQVPYQHLLKAVEPNRVYLVDTNTSATTDQGDIIDDDMAFKALVAVTAGTVQSKTNR